MRVEFKTVTYWLPEQVEIIRGCGNPPCPQPNVRYLEQKPVPSNYNVGFTGSQTDGVEYLNIQA